MLDICLKIATKIKIYSNFLIPGLVIATFAFLQKKNNILCDFEAQKIETIIDISVSMLGILLSVLAIYISFPEGFGKIDKVKKSEHHKIFVKNIITGVFLYMLSMILWIFERKSMYILLSFFGAISNTIVATYYIYVLAKTY